MAFYGEPSGKSHAGVNNAAPVYIPVQEMGIGEVYEAPDTNRDR